LVGIHLSRALSKTPGGFPSSAADKPKRAQMIMLVKALPHEAAGFLP